MDKANKIVPTAPQLCLEENWHNIMGKYEEIDIKKKTSEEEKKYQDIYKNGF